MTAVLAASLTAVITVSIDTRKHANPPPIDLHRTPEDQTAPSTSATASDTREGEAQVNVNLLAPAPIASQGEPGSTSCTEASRRRSASVGPSDPRLLFAYDTGGPILAMPATTAAGDVVVASLSGKIARLSPSGTPMWQVHLGDRIYSSPLISDDLIFVGCDNRRFTALSLATGKTRWVARVDGEADTAAAETPDGLIVAAAGQHIYGFTRQGAIRFRIKAARKVYASPVIADDGTIYVGSQDDHLYAISSSGRVLWRRDLEADVDCAAAIGEGGTIYAGTDAGRIFALDRNGSVLWTTTVGGFVRGGLTVTRDEKVIAGTYGPEPRVVALDGRTGTLLYSFAIAGTGAPEFGVHGSPVEDAQGNLYFGAPDHTLYALDAKGRLRWTFGAAGSFDAPVVVGPEGRLYAGSEDGHLYVLR